MSRRRIFAYASVALAFALVACADQSTFSDKGTPADASLNRAGIDAAGTHRRYGLPTKLGDGTIRTYVVLDATEGRALEVGVAMSEQSLEGLPATLPHFDFHFYTVPVDVRNSIVPSDPRYAEKAANYPTAPYRAPFYLDAATASGGVPAALVTVPQMGLHWLDVRSPELQKLTGHQEAWQQFTKTFIYGSWDGQFIFDEPMITRAYILAKKTATDPAAQQKKYRIALTQLNYRN